MAVYPKHVMDMIAAGEKQYNISPGFSAVKIAAKFLPYIRTMKLKKGEILLNFGETPDKFAFVNSGLLRRCYVDENGTYCTYLFMPDKTFFTDGIITDTSPSMFMIDALEDTELTFTPMSTSVKLGYENPEIMKSFFKACEYEIYNALNEWQRFTLSAADRYRYYLDKYPMLKGRVTQEIIASYIGITPESFSRLKSGFREE